VLNAIAPVGTEADEAAEAITELGAEVCPVRLVSRVAFSRALLTGLTAQEFEPEGKAAGEIQSLHKFVSARVHMFNTNRGTDHDQQVRKRA
jgi:chromosome partitioning protein